MKNLICVIITVLLAIGCDNNCAKDDNGVLFAEIGVRDSLGESAYTQALYDLSTWLMFYPIYDIEHLSQLGVKNPDALKILLIRIGCYEYEQGGVCIE